MTVRIFTTLLASSYIRGSFKCQNVKYVSLVFTAILLSVYSLPSATVEKRTLTRMNPLLLVITLAALILAQIASGFIVIESDYPEYDDYPQPQIPSRFPAQQSQEIRFVKKSRYEEMCSND